MSDEGIVFVATGARFIEEAAANARAARPHLGGRPIAIVTDDVAKVRGAVAALVADPTVDVVICTGGTGVTRRDITPEAIAPLASKPVPGFGELFRWLSYADIGASTIQSRADGWVCDGTLVFALPGSTGAVRLAMDKILLPQLDRRTKPCNFVQLLPRIKAEAPPA